MTRILITGGSGFIGTNLVAHFADRGDEVRNLDIASPRALVNDLYQVVGLYRRRPILALPMAPKGIRLTALRRYRAFSTRRSFFMQAVSTSIVTGVDKLIFPTTTEPLGKEARFDFNSWLHSLRSEIGIDCIASIVWPKQPQRHRLYVHLMTRSGRNILFVKIALDEPNEAALLAESEAVSHVNGGGRIKFRVPEFRGSGKSGGAFYTLYEPLPDTVQYSVPHPHEVRDWLATLGSPSNIESARLPQMNWWNRANTAVLAAQNSDFARDFHESTEYSTCVRPIHGDLGVHNVVHANGYFWIFDWEEWQGQGPCLSDEVAFYISLNRRRILRGPARALRSLFFDFNRHSRTELAMAIAFLAGNENGAAIALSRHWGPRDGSLR